MNKPDFGLNKRKQQVSTLLDNLPGLAYRCKNDIHWTMVFLSNGCHELTGYEPFELLDNQTLSYGNLIFPEDRKLVLDEIQTALKQGIPFSVEYRIQAKNNTIKWVWEKGHGLPGTGTHPEMIEGFITDITEQNRAEEINKVLFAISNAVNTTPDLEHLFKSIHHSLGSIIDVTNFFIALVDTQERTLHFPFHVDTVDDDFLPLTDFDTKDSLTGFAVAQRLPVLLKKKALEKRAGQKGVWGPVPLIWMGAPLIVKNEVIGVVAVQSYVNESLYTEQDLQVLSTISDQMAIAIDRKRANDALKESEEKYRQLFIHAPAGIYEIDFQKGNFIRVNEFMCTYTGFSEEEFLSMNPLNLLTQESKQLYLERMKKISTGEDLTHTAEYCIIHKNGRKLWVILNNDHTYKNGKLASARVVANDITELKKAQEEKIQAQKFAGEQSKMALVGQIAGKMAHDFNNILGIIMGNIELALLDCQDLQTRETLELIFQQTLRGKNLTKNLVAFAKDQEPKQEFFSIQEKIQLVVTLLKKDLEGIQLIEAYAKKLPDLLADPGMIEHALVNLIQNAIHAVSRVENPRITLGSYCLKDAVCFEIEDNGCGIPEEYIDVIYEPSFTLKGAKDLLGAYGPGIKGTGYGMANVKKYIEQHQGKIEVASALGSGTKFTIHLPIIQKELTPEERAEIRMELAFFGKHILLVEDEPALSDILFRVLTQEPCLHKVDIAGNGQMAMDLFAQNSYDLISLDYMLPGNFNGMDLYKHFRKTNKTIPILFISGNFEFLESIQALKQQDPHVDHLSKPSQNRAYVSSINKLLKHGLTPASPEFI